MESDLRQKFEADARDLDELLVVRHLSPRAEGETLRQVIDRIINWDVAVSLDPLISSDAQKLVIAGLREAAGICESNSAKTNGTVRLSAHNVDKAAILARADELEKGR